VGEDGKSVLMAVSLMAGFIFVLIYFSLVVVTVKSLFSAITSMSGGLEQTLADNAAFCARVS
jgi:hypothetical protein